MFNILAGNYGSGEVMDRVICDRNIDSAELCHLSEVCSVLIVPNFQRIEIIVRLRESTFNVRTAQVILDGLVDNERVLGKELAFRWCNPQYC